MLNFKHRMSRRGLNGGAMDGLAQGDYMERTTLTERVALMEKWVQFLNSLNVLLFWRNGFNSETVWWHRDNFCSNFLAIYAIFMYILHVFT